MKRWCSVAVLVSALLVLPLAGCDAQVLQTPPSTVLASKQLGPWLYQLYQVGQLGPDLIIEMGITNTSAEPLVWDRATVGIPNPTFIAVDSADQPHRPRNDTWYWLRKVRAEETIRGRLRFTFDRRPLPSTLYLGERALPFVPKPVEMLFPLE